MVAFVPGIGLYAPRSSHKVLNRSPRKPGGLRSLRSNFVSSARTRAASLTRRYGASMSIDRDNAVAAYPLESHDLQGLTLSKRDFQRGGKRGRPVRLKRSCQLRDIDFDLEGPLTGDETVRVEILSQSVNADFRVFGLVSTTVPRNCDRCLKTYNFATQGRFEVWLSSTGVESVKGMTKEEMDSLEAIEDFSGAEATVDLSSHARDAIILSLPSKSLCDFDCTGIAVKDNTKGSVRYGKVAPAPVEPDPSQSIRAQLSGTASEQLMKLKKQLESK